MSSQRKSENGILSEVNDVNLQKREGSIPKSRLRGVNPWPHTHEQSKISFPRGEPLTPYPRAIPYLVPEGGTPDPTSLFARPPNHCMQRWEWFIWMYPAASSRSSNNLSGYYDLTMNKAPKLLQVNFWALCTRALKVSLLPHQPALKCCDFSKFLNYPDVRRIFGNDYNSQ